MFCANFSIKRGAYGECNGAWCGGCYEDEGKDGFPVRPVLDEDGEPVVRGDEDMRFLKARPGDHYMTPFQCERCHFINVRGREPVSKRVEDETLLRYLRRVNLDAFWARETSTVSKNLAVLKQTFQQADKMGLKRVFPNLGPFPVKDTFGVSLAVLVLAKSLEKGKYEERVQWSTTRKTISALNNLEQVSVGGMGDAVGAYETKKVWMSSAPGHGFFFNRFKIGHHRRVGEVVKPDEPVTIELLHEVLNVLDKEWESEMTKTPRSSTALNKIAMSGAWYTVGFCAALRGEEMILIDLAGTKNSLSDAHAVSGNADKHFRITISSPTKNNRVTGGRINIPIAWTTKGTHIEAGKWIERYVCLQTRSKGPLFVSKLQVPKLFEFDDTFYGPLEKLKSDGASSIPTDLDVRVDFGTLRSLRRGSNGHATNQGVPTEVTHAINRWRSALKGSGEASLIQDKYARLDHIRPTMLKYSMAL